MSTVQDVGMSIGVLIPHSSLNIGRLTRCGTYDKPKSKNGWYFHHDSDSCTVGNWATGEVEHWFSERVNSWSDDNRKKYLEELRQQRESAEEIARQEAQERIDDGWRKAQNCSSAIHGYLVRKKILQMPDFKRGWHNDLLIPMYNIFNKLVGYQRIFENGDKVMATGSQLKGSFYPLGDFPSKNIDLFFLAEGYASGCSAFISLSEIFDAKSICMFVCFSAGNVLNVAKQLQDIYGADPVLIADNDDAGLKPLKYIKGFSLGYTRGYDANDVVLEYGQDKLTELLEDKMKDLERK